MDIEAIKDISNSNTKSIRANKELPREPKSKITYYDFVFSDSMKTEIKEIPLDTYTNTIQFEHTFNGVSFLLEKEDNCIFLTHPTWSLCGSGTNLLEAEIDLISQAKDVFEDYAHATLNELTEEAILFRDFLFRFV